MDTLEAVIDETLEAPLENSVDETPVEESKEPEAKAKEEHVDGRKFNPEWSKYLKEIREAYASDPEKGPKIADMLTKLRDETARQLQFRELAPGGLDDYRNLKTTVDALGGPEAAAELMSRSATFEAIDAKLLASDITVVDDMPEEMQKGFYGMVPEALNRLAETDKDAFTAAVKPHFQAALVGAGLGEHLKKMYAAAGDNQELKNLIQQQFDWFTQQTQGSGTLPAKTATPQQSRAEKELAELRKTQDELFVKSASETALSYRDKSFETGFATYAKQLNLSDAQKADLLESFQIKIVNQLANDKGFQKQLVAYKATKNRDPKAVNDFIQATIDRYAKPTLDGLVTARYPKANMRPKSTPTDTTPTTNNGMTRVAQAPSVDQWDRAKMEAEGYAETAKKGIYHLKGGRTVQVVH